jgi:hypothetical protein
MTVDGLFVKWKKMIIFAETLYCSLEKVYGIVGTEVGIPAIVNSIRHAHEQQ